METGYETGGMNGCGWRLEVGIDPMGLGTNGGGVTVCPGGDPENGGRTAAATCLGERPEME